MSVFTRKTRACGINSFLHSAFRLVKIVCAFTLCVLFLSACAGTRNSSEVSDVIRSMNGEPVVPREANKIIIPFFRNYTYEPSLAEKLTIELRQMINMEGRLAVVADNENADLRLAGMIDNYEIQPVQLGNFGEAVRKRLRITASVKLIDLNRDREIFYEREIQSFEVFSDVIAPIVTESQCRERVLEKLARRISVKVINGWYTELMTPVEKGKR